MSLAHESLVNLNDDVAMNVIVVFSDGSPTAYTSEPLSITGSSYSGATMAGTVHASGNANWVWGLQLVNAGLPPVQQESFIGGCGWSWQTSLGSSVSRLEDKDFWGNDVTGPRSVSSPYDVTGQRVQDMAWNSASNAALRARSHGSIPTRVFSIGLGDPNATGTAGVDSELLRNMANDPEALTYNQYLPIGKYVFAPSKEQLAAVLSQVKSEIHRILQ